MPLLFGHTRWSSNFLMIDRLVTVDGMLLAVNKVSQTSKNKFICTRLETILFIYL